MEKIPRKSSAARVIFFGSGNFLSEHTHFFVANGKNIIHYPIFNSDVLSFTSLSISHFTKCIL